VVKATPGDGRSSRSARWRSALEEGDGLLERRSSKVVVVVGNLAAQGRQLVVGGTVARLERSLCSVDGGVAVKERRRGEWRGEGGFELSMDCSSG
jgi:hypothetical protein